MCVSPFLGQKYTSVLKDSFFRKVSKGETREIVSKNCSARFSRRVRTELSVLSVRTFPRLQKKSALSPLIPRQPPTLSPLTSPYIRCLPGFKRVGNRDPICTLRDRHSFKFPEFRVRLLCPDGRLPLYYDTQCLPSPPRQRPRAAVPRAKPPVLRPRTTRAFRPLRMPTSNSRPWGPVRPSAQSPWGRISCNWLELERSVRCRICLRPRN